MPTNIIVRDTDPAKTVLEVVELPPCLERGGQQAIDEYIAADGAGRAQIATDLATQLREEEADRLCDTYPQRFTSQEIAASRSRRGLQPLVGG